MAATKLTGNLLNSTRGQIVSATSILNISRPKYLPIPNPKKSVTSVEAKTKSSNLQQQRRQTTSSSTSTTVTASASSNSTTPNSDPTTVPAAVVKKEKKVKKELNITNQWKTVEPKGSQKTSGGQKANQVQVLQTPPSKKDKEKKDKRDKNQKPGDWTCPKCQAHCFRKKSHCFKCKAAKPGQAVPSQTSTTQTTPPSSTTATAAASAPTKVVKVLQKGQKPPQTTSKQARKTQQKATQREAKTSVSVSSSSPSSISTAPVPAKEQKKQTQVEKSRVKTKKTTATAAVDVSAGAKKDVKRDDKQGQTGGKPSGEDDLVGLWNTLQTAVKANNDSKQDDDTSSQAQASQDSGQKPKTTPGVNKGSLPSFPPSQLSHGPTPPSFFPVPPQRMTHFSGGPHPPRPGMRPVMPVVGMYPPPPPPGARGPALYPGAPLPPQGYPMPMPMPMPMYPGAPPSSGGRGQGRGSGRGSGRGGRAGRGRGGSKQQTQQQRLAVHQGAADFDLYKF